MSAQLMTHAGAKMVTMDELRALPTPVARGSRHCPVPHWLLAESLEIEAQERGYDVSRAQFALGMNGSALFGVIDLVPSGVVDVTLGDGHGLSIGFRNSVNSMLAIKAVAGARVFVCDNLALNGDMVAVLRKNTMDLSLEDALREGFDRIMEHAGSLERSIMRLQAAAISDMAAKARIFDVFAAGILPIHLFDDVDANYFRRAEDLPDCSPRTEWGLHNAFTRAMKPLGLGRTAMASNVALGRAFGLTESNS